MVSSEGGQDAIGIVGVEIGLLHCQVGHAVRRRRMERRVRIAGRRAAVRGNG